MFFIIGILKSTLNSIIHNYVQTDTANFLLKNNWQSIPYKDYFLCNFNKNWNSDIFNLHQKKEWLHVLTNSWSNKPNPKVFLLLHIIMIFINTSFPAGQHYALYVSLLYSLQCAVGSILYRIYMFKWRGHLHE